MFKRLKKYFWNILISIDQFGNILFGGDPDETISSRLGKMKSKKTLGWFDGAIAWVLNKIDKDHVERSIEEDEGSNASL